MEENEEESEKPNEENEEQDQGEDSVRQQFSFNPSNDIEAGEGGEDEHEEMIDPNMPLHDF